MKRIVIVAGMLAGLAAAFSAPPEVHAQDKTPAAKPIIPLKVDVVLSRYEADKKISSLPFALFVNLNAGLGGNRTSVRMGVDVPVGTSASTSSNQGGGEQKTTTTPQYRNVGTSIDIYEASQMDDGRFLLNIAIQDSSIYMPQAGAASMIRVGDPMAFRSFSTNNRLVCRDGQTVQFTMATDKISGEVLKVDVTVSVIK